MDILGGCTNIYIIYTWNPLMTLVIGKLSLVLEKSRLKIEDFRHPAKKWDIYLKTWRISFEISTNRFHQISSIQPDFKKKTLDFLIKKHNARFLKISTNSKMTIFYGFFNFGLIPSANLQGNCEGQKRKVLLVS